MFLRRRQSLLRALTETERTVDVVQSAVDLEKDVAEDAGDGVGINSAGLESAGAASGLGDLGDGALDERGELADLVLVVGGSRLVLGQGRHGAEVGGGRVWGLCQHKLVAGSAATGSKLTDGAGDLLNLREQARDDVQDGTDVLTLLLDGGGHAAKEKAGKSEDGEELHCDCCRKSECGWFKRVSSERRVDGPVGGG